MVEVGQVEAAAVMSELFANLPRMRFAITGADGFIGSYLAAALAKAGHAVHALGFAQNGREIERVGRAAYHLYERMHVIDVRDIGAVEYALRLARPDIVIHLAAISQVKDAEIVPYQSYQTNAMGTLNVLEVVRYMAERPLLITASTDKVYGDAAHANNFREDSALAPVHPYDTSKAAGDLMAQSYGQFFQVPVVITRCANVYGPGDTNWQRLIPGVVRDLLNERRPYIRSDGSPIREYIFIDDYCRCIEAIAAFWHWDVIERLRGRRPPWAMGETYNIAGERRSVLHVVEAIEKIMMTEVPPYIAGESTTESAAIMLEGSKFTSTFGPTLRTAMAERGLELTINWLVDLLATAEWKQEWMDRRSTPK